MNNLIDKDTSSFASFIKAAHYLLEGIWMVQKHGQEFETFQSLATTSVLFFFQTMAFENLRNIFSWKYSFGNSLNTLMSFKNIFRLSIEKVTFYWLGDITYENRAYRYIRRWMEKKIYKKRLGPKNSVITSISNVLFC